MSAQSNKKKRLGSRRAPAHQSKLVGAHEHAAGEDSADQHQVPEVPEVLESVDHVSESGVSRSRRKLGSSRKKTETLHLEPKEEDNEDTSLDATLETHISATASIIQFNRGKNEMSATLDGSFATTHSEYVETEVGLTLSPEIPRVWNPQDGSHETNLRATETFDSPQSGETESTQIPAEITLQSASAGFQDDHPVGELPVPFSVIINPSSWRETSESIEHDLDLSKEEFTTNEMQRDPLKSSETSDAQFPRVGVNENHEKDESKHLLLNYAAFPSKEEHVGETDETSRSLLSVQTTDTEDVLADEDDQIMGFIRGKNSECFQDDAGKCSPITGGQESAAGQIHGGFDNHDEQTSDEQNVQEEQPVPFEVEQSKFSLQSSMSELRTPFKSHLHNSSDGDTNLSGIAKDPGSCHKEKHVQESADCGLENDNALKQLLETETGSQKEPCEDSQHDLNISVSQDSPSSPVFIDGHSEDPDVLLPCQEPDWENFSLWGEKLSVNPEGKEAQTKVNDTDEHLQQKEEDSDGNPRPHCCESEVPKGEGLHHSSETVANEAISKNEICLESLMEQTETNTFVHELPGKKTSSTSENISSYDDEPAASPKITCKALNIQDEDTKKTVIRDKNQVDLAPRQEHQSMSRVQDQRKFPSEQIFLVEMQDKSALSSFQSQSSVSSEAQPRASTVCLVDPSRASFHQSQSTAGQENPPADKNPEEKAKQDTAKTQKMNVQADSDISELDTFLVSQKEEELINEWCYGKKQEEEPPSVPLVTCSERQECTTAERQNDIVQHLIVCEPEVGLSIERCAAESCSQKPTETKGRLEITSTTDERLTGEEQLADVRAARHSENESALMQGSSHSHVAQNHDSLSKIQSTFTEAHQSKLTVEYDEPQANDKKGVDSALGDVREIKVQEENAPNPNTRETGLILKEQSSKTKDSESSSAQDDSDSHFNSEDWQNSASLSYEGNTEVSSLSSEKLVEIQPERTETFDSFLTENLPDLDFIPLNSSTKLPEKKEGDSDVEVMMSYGNLPSKKLPSQNTDYICTPQSPTVTMNPKDQTSSPLQATFTTNYEPFGLLNPAGSQHVSSAHREQINQTQEIHQTDYNSFFQKACFPQTDKDWALKSQHLDYHLSKAESGKPAGNRRKFGSSRKNKDKQHNKVDEASQESKEEEVKLTGHNEEITTMSQGEPEDVLFVAKVRKINSAEPEDKKSSQLQEGTTAFLNNELVDSIVAILDKEDSSKSHEDKHGGCGKEPGNSSQPTGYDSVKNEKIQSSEASVWTSRSDTQSNLYHDDIISPESVLVPDQKEAFQPCITLDRDSHQQEIHLEEDRNLLKAVAEDTNQDITVDEQVKPPSILEDSASQTKAVVSLVAFHTVDNKKNLALSVKMSEDHFTSSELPENSKPGSSSIDQLPATDSGRSVSLCEMTKENDYGQVDVQISQARAADEEQPGNKKEGMQGKNPEIITASPDLNLSKKKRKMGSTRRSLGTQAKKENSQQRKELEDEVTNTLIIDEAKQTELTFEEKHPQFHTEHRDDSCEQRKKELFEAVESSHSNESTLKPLGPEGSPVPESQLEKPEHLLTPNPPLTAFPNNDTVSEAASGARRKKFGSNRKSHMHQNKKDRAPRDTEVTVGIPVEDTAQEAEEPRLDTGSEVDRQQNKKAFLHISSTPASKDTLAQSQQITIHPDKANHKQLVADDPRESELTSGSYNVVLIGDSSVGKTSFMKRAQNGKFFSEVQASIGLDSCEWTVVVDGKRVVMCLWDTAGQERFRCITRQIFHKAHAFLLMYDITSSQSFSALSYWANWIQEAASENVTVVLLGNKSDHAKRQVKTQQGDILAKEYNFTFMECSAATGENVLEALETVGRLLSQRDDLKEETTKLSRDLAKKKRSGCC